MHSAKSRKIIYFILMSLLCIFTFATMNSNIQQLDADTHITFDGEDFFTSRRTGAGYIEWRTAQ